MTPTEISFGAWESYAFASLVTLLAWAESRWLPWSPFILVSAVLTAVIPWLSGSLPFGDILTVFANHAGLIVTMAGLFFLWESGICYGLYERVILRIMGTASDPRFAPSLAFKQLLEEGGKKAGFTPVRFRAVLIIYHLVWAPWAEETFYWGFLYSHLRNVHGFWATAAIVSAFFALRHATHFTFIRPRYPWPAALGFSSGIFISGMLNSYLFVATGSLWPPIALHFLSNLPILWMSPGSEPRPPSTTPGSRQSAEELQRGRQI